MMVFSELLIGIAMGVATNIVFDGVQMAGQVLSVQMGYSLVSILDPQTLAESTVVATFHQTMPCLSFCVSMSISGFSALSHAASIIFLPPQAISGGAFAGCSAGRGRRFHHRGPDRRRVLSATMFADIALGLLGKASPQLPVMLLGPAVKSVLGLLVLIPALKYWPNLFDLVLRSIVTADHLLHLVGSSSCR